MSTKASAVQKKMWSIFAKQKTRKYTLHSEMWSISTLRPSTANKMEVRPSTANKMEVFSSSAKSQTKGLI